MEPARPAGADRPVCAYAAWMSRILYFRDPLGVVTSTVSPFFLPMIALPTGRPARELQLGGVGLGRADDEVLVRALGVDGREPPSAPTETTLVSTLPVSITRAFVIRRSSSWAIRWPSIACSFLLPSYSAFS